MKILDGLDLAGFIKERQLKQVRALRQSWQVFPRLAIVRTGNNPVIDTYVKLKKQYGVDILVDVDIYEPDAAHLLSQIEALNQDDSVHGVIIQLPLAFPEMTDDALKAVAPHKDVDGLGVAPKFTPATAMAIDWLLAGYNVELKNKKIAIVGKGRLVGMPLAKLWQSCGYDVTICDSKTIDMAGVLRLSDIVVTATGVPRLITSDMLKQKAVVVDAGTAAEHGKIVGDLSEDIRARNDLTITPVKGGVGPLTVVALFDNVINAARLVAEAQGQKDI
jgi:methylenetetrahydrofolate dehydrogenase (NADP+) / methenyltetrahydrofolate cyclohydrolase